MARHKYLVITIVADMPNPAQRTIYESVAIQVTVTDTPIIPVLFAGWFLQTVRIIHFSSML